MPAAVAEREGASTERSNGGLPAPTARRWAMSFATIMLKAGRVPFTVLAAAGLVLAMIMLKAGRVAFTVLGAAGLVLAIVFVVGVSVALALGDDHEGLILVATSATYCGCLVAWFVMRCRRRLAEENRGWPRVRTPGARTRPESRANRGWPMVRAAGQGMAAAGWQLSSFARLPVVAISLRQYYGYASGNETAVERGRGGWIQEAQARRGTRLG